MHVSNIKIVMYLLVSGVLYYCRDDLLVYRLCFPLSLLTIVSELYWWLIEYPAPAVHFFVFSISLYMFLRYALAVRMFVTIKYLKLPAHFLDIDSSLRKIAKWTIFCYSASLIEYLIRHTTSLSPDYIYQIAPYIQQSLTIITLTVIVDHIFKNQFSIDA